jgi:hypothetical protein
MSYSTHIHDKCADEPFETYTYQNVFETFQSFGHGSLYTTCDGIPRFRFLASPTLTTTSTVTVHGVDRFQNPFCSLKLSELRPFCSVSPKVCNQMWISKSNPYYSDFLGTPEIRRMKEPCNLNLMPSHACSISFQNHLNEVVLIYWPSAVESRNCDSNEAPSAPAPVSNFQRTFTTDAITFRGQDLYRLKRHNDEWILTEHHVLPSVLRGQWTFTYPTQYIAHRPLTGYSIGNWGQHGARDTLNRTSLTAGILALQSDDIYSSRPKRERFGNSGTSYAQLVAKGDFNVLRPSIWDDDDLTTVPFNFRDLQNPVPASVYYDARSDDCWGRQSHCGTITDDSYRPNILIKNRFWNSVLNEWSSCVRPGLVDPPISLVALPESTLSPPSLVAITSAGFDSAPATVPALPSPTISAGLAGSTGGASGHEHKPVAGDVDPARLVKIEPHNLLASIVSGTPVALFIETSTLLLGHSATVNRKVVRVAEEGIQVDGAVVLSASATGRVPGGSVSSPHGGANVGNLDSRQRGGGLAVWDNFAKRLDQPSWTLVLVWIAWLTV